MIHYTFSLILFSNILILRRSLKKEKKELTYEYIEQMYYAMVILTNPT